MHKSDQKINKSKLLSDKASEDDSEEDLSSQEKKISKKPEK